MASSTFRAGQVVRLRYMQERYGKDVHVRLLRRQRSIGGEEPAWAWELVRGVFDLNGWDREHSFERLNGLLDI